MTKPINVYWAVFSDLKLISRQSLLYGEIERLIPSMVNEAQKNDEYFKCFALNALHKNTYFLRHPFNVEIDFTGKDIEQEHLSSYEKNELVKVRNPKLHDRITFDLDYQMIAFADEPLLMVNTPPYMHKTLFPATAYQTSGAFDIGKWFRPLALTYQMFPNETKVSFREGEPFCYATFITEQKIKLHRFEMNDKLKEVVNGATHLKWVKKNLPLNNLYDRFKNAHRRELVLREIKRNLI